MANTTQPTPAEQQPTLQALADQEIGALKNTIEQLQGQLTGAATAYHALEEEKEALADNLKAKEAELTAALEVIAQQHLALSAAEEQSGSNDVIITHEKKKYRVAVPKFQFGGDAYTADDLKNGKNKELAGKLISLGSSVLVAL